MNHSTPITDQPLLSVVGADSRELRRRHIDVRQRPSPAGRDQEEVDQERRDLDILRATAKVRLKEAAATLGKDFKADLTAVNGAQINELFQGDKGIIKQSEAFHKLKKQKVWKAFKKGALIGGAIGLGLHRPAVQ